MARPTKQKSKADLIKSDKGEVFVPLPMVNDNGEAVVVNAKVSRNQLRDALLLANATNSNDLHYDGNTINVTTYASALEEWQEDMNRTALAAEPEESEPAEPEEEEEEEPEINLD